MTRHDIAARADNLVVGIIAAVALASLLAYTQTKDEADHKLACAYVAEQAREAAQPETWARLAGP